MRTAVAYLDRLTHPTTRWVLFALTDRWTAVINNLRDGSDFADDAVLVARLKSTTDILGSPPERYDASVSPRLSWLAADDIPEHVLLTI